MSRLKCCLGAYSVLFIVMGLLLTGCDSKTRFELDKQPKRVAPGATIPIGLTAINPPQGARYVWYSDQGKFDPPETDTGWTKYLAPTQPGEYHLTVEVKNGNRTLFSDGVSVTVVAPVGSSSAASSQQSSEASSVTSNGPAIRITEVPTYDPVGGPVALEGIAGDVSGVDPKNFRIVLYAFTDNWYVQPYVMAPFTEIDPDGKWRTQSHLGSRYAALLVKPTFHPRSIAPSLPGVGDDVVAITFAQRNK